ncbi:uncharacterized protein with HEPN domain [Fontibacillus solani]|uniref:Uncharacterized protein with HEPN domain n=1 Tax=Fontibacillus solani TaxID=1572857 RepID=A0A7W3XSV1_9BACL|nr:hypothetical protein [Fontibacillus solani]MBA9086915.1 uncharacterized protein with HEPN domain [Fontibacillus solani]
MVNNAMPDNEQSKELFTYFGLAVYYSQALEQLLANLIMTMKLSKEDVYSEEKFTENFRKKLGKSLGQLVKEIQQHFSFSDEEMSELTGIWKQRNYIVHDYFKVNIHDSFTSDGRTAMIKELKDFSTRAEKLYSRLQRYNEQLLHEVDPIDNMEE